MAKRGPPSKFQARRFSFFCHIHDPGPLPVAVSGGAVVIISPLLSSWTPGVFYTYSYNHAHRLRLEKLLYLQLSRSPNGFFKPLLDPGGGFRSEMAVTKPFRK
jgi:hypothetical protein